jgi:benzoyl-CoA reductase/2-hydroxyglutaryl-CoA dehydratase subunit BcrC/BadD/HgdB
VLQSIKTTEHLNGFIKEYTAMIKHMAKSSDEEIQLQVPMVQLLVEQTELLIQCVEKDEPVIMSWFNLAPEIFSAMDVVWYDLSQLIAPTARSTVKILAAADQLSLPKDICSLQRLMMSVIRNEEVPVPTAIIALLYPCDGISPFHDAVIQLWRNIPYFAIDPPYENDERSIAYAAGEFRRMISFLEEQTGKKLDFDRLKKTVEESNAQYRLFMEYNELKRAIPCPHQSFSGTILAPITQCFYLSAGKPRGTAILQSFVDHAEKRVKENKGSSFKERIRVYWADLPPNAIMAELRPWLQEEWGANVVMDYVSDCPYEIIDTSSEETIVRGLANRSLNHSFMIRQARGRIDTVINDYVRIVKSYKIDCVFIPGHMGHKDGSASLGLLKEVCRELGVPSLYIGMDLWDPKYTPIDELKDKISIFFSTMELG